MAGIGRPSGETAPACPPRQEVHQGPHSSQKNRFNIYVCILTILLVLAHVKQIGYENIIPKICIIYFHVETLKPLNAKAKQNIVADVSVLDFQDRRMAQVKLEVALPLSCPWLKTNHFKTISSK